MVGGPTKGTQFRPLSLNVPKSLFPLAGQPMVHHPISACQGVPTTRTKCHLEAHHPSKLGKSVKSISAVTVEVDRFTAKVKALEAIVLKGQKVVEEDVIQLIELLMLQLVKLDEIAIDDDFLNFDDDFLSSFLDTPLDISAFTSNRTPVEQSIHASPKSPTSIVVAAQAYSHVFLPLRSCLVMSSLWEVAAAATTAQIIALELQQQ